MCQEGRPGGPHPNPSWGGASLAPFWWLRRLSDLPGGARQSHVLTSQPPAGWLQHHALTRVLRALHCIRADCQFRQPVPHRHPVFPAANPPHTSSFPTVGAVHIIAIFGLGNQVLTRLPKATREDPACSLDCGPQSFASRLLCLSH